MSPVTAIFLAIGGLGIAVLAFSLFLGDVLSFGHPDAEGPFSLPAVAGFVGAFGFGGAIAAALVGNHPAFAATVGALTGIVAAVPTAWLAVRMSRAAQQMHTDATPTRGDLIGRLGVVVTPIPDQGYGEIRVSLGGQPIKLNAKADRPMPLGAQVFVVEAPSDTSVVVEPALPA